VAPGINVVTTTIGVILKDDGAIHEHLLLVSKLWVDGDEFVVESHGHAGRARKAWKYESAAPDEVVKLDPLFWMLYSSM